MFSCGVNKNIIIIGDLSEVQEWRPTCLTGDPLRPRHAPSETQLSHKYIYIYRYTFKYKYKTSTPFTTVLKINWIFYFQQVSSDITIFERLNLVH